VDGLPQQRFLRRGDVPNERGGLIGRGTASPPERALSGAGRVHQHAMEARLLGECTAVARNDEHVGMPQTIDVSEEAPDPSLVDLRSDKRTPALHEFGDVGRLPTGRGAEVEDPLVSPGIQCRRRDACRRLLHIDQPEPMFQRERNRIRCLLHLEEGWHAVDGPESETLVVQASGEGFGVDPAGSHTKNGGLGSPGRLGESRPVGDDRPVPLEIYRPLALGTRAARASRTGEGPGPLRPPHARA
jgi:hypothetical protein